MTPHLMAKMSLGDTSHTERWAEEPFRLVADIAPVLMWILDASLGCTYVNCSSSTWSRPSEASVRRLRTNRS
jgi:hypothetical protein